MPSTTVALSRGRGTTSPWLVVLAQGLSGTRGVWVLPLGILVVLGVFWFAHGRTVHVGHVRWGFEQNEFVPCGGGTAWVNDHAGLWDRYSKTVPSHGQWAFVRIRGAMSLWPGRHGHLDRYPRQVTVTEVLEMRPGRTLSDCTSTD